MRINHIKGTEMAAQMRALARQRYFILVFGLTLGAGAAWYMEDKNPKEIFHERHTFKKPDRLVRVMIVFDKYFVGKRSYSSAEHEARSLLRDASKYFEKSVGIQFVPRRTEQVTPLSLDFLANAYRYDCDVVVGLTGKHPTTTSLSGDTGGAEKGDAVVLLSTYYGFRLSRVLAHEIGHIFGAWHREKPRHLMHPDGTFMGDALDDWNWRVIMFNKYHDFPR